MFSKIINFFKEKEWIYTIIEDKTIAILGISGKNGKLQCIADVSEDEKKMIFFSVCNSNVSDDKKLLMCELLTRINHGKFLGNFEMDFEDGEIRYKTSIYYGDLELSNDVIENLIMTNIVTMDNALVSIMQLIFSDTSPIQAYNSIVEMKND